jgi:hypothetical protein
MSLAVSMPSVLSLSAVTCVRCNRVAFEDTLSFCVMCGSNVCEDVCGGVCNCNEEVME